MLKNSLSKKALISVGCIAIVSTIVSIALTTSSSIKTSGDVCDKHVGNHYSALAPTEQSSGTKEYYICCKCHTVILSNEHVEGDGDWTNQGQAQIVEPGHKAYDAMYHSLHGKFSGKEHWSDVKMIKNPSKDTEYMLLNTGLTKGDQFVIRMDGDNWYHYQDVKDGAKKWVTAEGDNIVIKETGSYNIYCDTASTDGHIWIEKDTAVEPRIVGNFSSPEWSYEQGIAMTKTGENTYNTEVEVELGVSIKIFDNQTWYGNWDKTSSENKNAYMYTCYSIDEDGNARFNADGTFKITLTTGTNPQVLVEIVNVDSPYKMAEHSGSYSQKTTLIYQSIKDSVHDKVVYRQLNQVFRTGETIQILYRDNLVKFKLGDNTDKQKFVYYEELTSAYIYVPNKVSDYHNFYLYLNTSDMSYTVDIVAI